jgi:hypothetical protein
MMQRLGLHLRGVKVPPLGSLQDTVFRGALNYEKSLEAKRAEFSMLTTLTNPIHSSDHKAREWKTSVLKAWKGYIGLLMNVEMPEHDASESKMIEYYSKVVKNLKPKMSKTRDGKLQVTGLDALTN